MELVDLEIQGCGGLSMVMEGSADGPPRPYVLQVQMDAVTYLGAVCDHSGNPREWVEIRIQEIAGLEDGFDGGGPECSGPLLDQRWRRMTEGYAKGAAELMIRGEWEKVHGEPVFIDTAGTRRTRPDGGWTLCQDDQLLERHRLPTFSGSWHRYLVSHEGTVKFVPLTASATRSPDTIEFEEAFRGLQVVNREAGLMMISRAPGLKYEDFADFLAGKDFGEHPRDLLRVPPVGIYKTFLDKNAQGQAGIGYINGRSSLNERLAEILFLKLSLLRGAMELLKSATEAQKMPFLGISGDSFGVHLAEPAASLPFLWNHRVSLFAVPGVVPMPLGPSGDQMMVQCGPISQSIYRAGRAAGPKEGKGRVRFRKISPADAGGLWLIEGTLQTDESLEVSRKDLLELDIRLPRGKRLRIRGYFMTLKAVQGESRFLSLPMDVAPEIVADMEGGGLQITERVDFRIIPGVGSTADLYSIAVVAVRTLFSRDVPLSETMDDMLELIHAYGQTFERSDWDTGSGNLASFINSEKGKLWREKLGPARVGEGVSAEAAAQAIPPHLWWRAVEYIGRLFPGEMPGSFAKDFDDFDSRAPERVYAEPLAALDGLIETCRSLLFWNPVASREILSVIRGVATRLG